MAEITNGASTPNGNSHMSNAYFKQMMVSIMPRCTMGDRSRSAFGDVGQLSQVGAYL